MTRADIHKRFAEVFASRFSQPAIPKLSDIEKVEESLSTTFPQSYIEFLTTYGAVHTPAILDLVTGGESEEAPDGASFDIQNFFSVDQIEETTRSYWSGGMDDTLVPVASDCMRNVFGFSRASVEERPDDLPVLVFDHDFVTIDEEAGSFDEWLKSFSRCTTKQSRTRRCSERSTKIS